MSWARKGVRFLVLGCNGHCWGGIALKAFSIGYGGRSPSEFVTLLQSARVATVVDVRLRPDRSRQLAYVKTPQSDGGIESILRGASIDYVWLGELGNLFIGLEDWEYRYRRLMRAAGDLLTDRVTLLRDPICLMCAERDVRQCHRRFVADWLMAERGYEFTHLS